MKTGTINRAPWHMERVAKGQAMSEFLMMASVAFIVLFVAIQMAALGREGNALGQLSYQVSRWATNPGNNGIAGTNSPQCSDVVNLIKGANVSPYSSPPLGRPDIWAKSQAMAWYAALPQKAESGSR